MNPGNCIFLLRHCMLLYNQTQKHIQIITWLSLNHPSLSVGYVSNSVNASCYQTRCKCHFFLSATQRISAWCTRHSSAVLLNCGPSSPKLNSNDYNTRFPESYSSEDISCKSAKFLKSKELLVKLRETFKVRFSRCYVLPGNADIY